jgi:hypothetical protein
MGVTPAFRLAPALRRTITRLAVGAALAAPLLAALACVKQPTAAVSMKMIRRSKTPADATVIIDEEYIGPLAYVAARGVRLPVGTHRITVERDGYFPFDTTVVADRKPIFLEIKLTPIPD